MPVLSAGEVHERLKVLHAWKLVEGEIVREAAFKDFIDAMGFVNQVAGRAEAAGHHPDFDIRYNKVRLALVSHDAGGLTEKDFNLAATIEAILAARA
ncbi:MAG: 4a-hydroxytetrahydrobiopterin dehydratase [Silvibacterium sp.]